MPSRRMIDPAIWQSESMADLTRDQRLLFIGLFSNADDQGRLRGNPNLIRSIIFPYDDDITTDGITADLRAISKQDCIIIYEADGKEIIQITHWWDYQSPQWAYPSKLPPPPGWYDRLRYRKDNSVITYNWKPDHGSNDNLPPPNMPQPEPPSNGSLGKALPKDLPNAQGGPIELVLELGLEIENKEEVEARAAFSQISTFYQNEIGPLSPVIRDKLLEMCKEHPPDWITKAITVSVEQNQRKLSYVNGILSNWKTIGGPQNDLPKSLRKNSQQRNGDYKNGNKQSTAKNTDTPDGIEPDTWANIVASFGT